MRACCVIVFLLCLATQHVLAQEKPDSVGNSYVQRFPDKFDIWPVIKKRSLQFDISTISDRSHRLNYEPNNSMNAGVGLYLFEVVLEVTVAIPVYQKNTDIYGKSDARDLQVNIFGRKWLAEIFHQNYSGFYVEDPNNLVPADEQFNKRADINLTTTGANYIYIFNHERFSLRSCYNFSERQLKSNGSFVVTSTLTTSRLSGDSTVLGNAYAPFFSPKTSFTAMNYTTLSVAPGYTYSLVYRSFFANWTLSLGPANHWITYRSPGEKEQFDMALNTFADVRVAVGYNGPRFFCGMNFVTQSRTIRFDDTQYATSNSTFKLLLGYRFREIGFLKKKVKDIVPIPIK